VHPDGTPSNDDRSAYLAEFRHVDREVGRLLEEARKLEPDGVFVVTADHAIAFDDARHQRVHYAYDLSTVVLRVPLVIAGKVIAPGRHRDPVSSLDLAPTLVNLAGVGGSLPFLGRSLVPALAGDERESHRWIFSQFYLAEDLLVGRDPLRLVGVRDHEFSMVQDRRRGLVEAWAYRDDPFEARDLWPGDEPATRARLHEMKRVLDDFVHVTHPGPGKARSTD
jgi:arylsulfatase A-like enzyme